MFLTSVQPHKVARFRLKLVFLDLFIRSHLDFRMDKYESYHADWESSERPPNFDMEAHIRDTWSWFKDVLKSPKVPFWKR